MAVSIYLSPDLLDRVDRAAQRRGMSRSQFVSVILATAVANDEDWPRVLYDELVESAKGVRTPTDK